MSKQKPTPIDDPTEVDEPPAESAIEAEATGARTLVARWGDQEWIVPASLDDWPFDALEAYGRLVESAKSGENDFVAFRHQSELASGVLGPRQWQRFANGPRRTAKDLAELGQAIFATYDEARRGE